MTDQQPPGEEFERRVLEELQKYVGLSRLGQQRGFDGPALNSLVTNELVTIDAVIEHAVEKIADERYRLAAFELLVNPTNRTANLTTRSKAAASGFGVAYETFRKKVNGVNQRTEVLSEVAAKLASQRPNLEPPPQTSEDFDPRRSKLVSAGVLFALVAVGVWAATTFGGRASGDDFPASASTSEDEPETVELLGEVDVSLYCEMTHGSGWVAAPELLSSPDWTCRSPAGALTEPADIEAACREQYGASSEAVNQGGSSGWRCLYRTTAAAAAGECPIDAGTYDPSLANEFARFAASFRERFEAAGGAPVLGCPTTVMHRWTKGVMQEIGNGEQTTAGLLAVDEENTVLLRGNSWQAFDRIKGINGTIVGFPSNEPEPDGEYFVVKLDAGGSLLAEAEPGPYFWLPPVMLPYWVSTGGADGCLGFPITDPYASGESFKQDFEYGRLVFSPLSGAFTNEGADCE